MKRKCKTKHLKFVLKSFVLHLPSKKLLLVLLFTNYQQLLVLLNILDTQFAKKSVSQTWNGFIRIIAGICTFFLSWFSFSNIHSSQDSRGRGEAISVTPLYLGISRTITAESSLLHISNSQIKTGIFGFQAKVANHYATRQNLFVCWFPALLAVR